MNHELVSCRYSYIFFQAESTVSRQMCADADDSSPLPCNLWLQPPLFQGAKHKYLFGGGHVTADNGGRLRSDRVSNARRAAQLLRNPRSARARLPRRPRRRPHKPYANAPSAEKEAKVRGALTHYPPVGSVSSSHNTSAHAQVQA